MRVECAWYGAIIQDGPEDADISHGLCDDCYEKAMREIDDREDEDE